MTGEYDRNIVYRQEWKKGSQKEIKNLDWREAMLYVTTPTVIGNLNSGLFISIIFSLH